MKTYSLIISFIYLLFSSSFLIAEDKKQNFVIGIGSGSFTFNSEDDLRKGQGIEEKGEIKTVGSSSFFVDFFFEDSSWGIGQRNSTNSFKRDLEFNDGTSFNEEWNIQTTVYTLSYILNDPKSEYRWVAFGGTGQTNYNYKNGFNGNTNCNTSICEDIDTSSTGAATSYGLYLDWGIEGWGIRGGYYAINTNLDPIKNNQDEEIAKVDASGTGYSIDLRYAW